jgi:hypothetical protein
VNQKKRSDNSANLNVMQTTYTFFFTHQHRRSTKTLRLHYGLEGMKYIIQMYEGEINGHGEKEGLPTEYQYELNRRC